MCMSHSHEESSILSSGHLLMSVNAVASFVLFLPIFLHHHSFFVHLFLSSIIWFLLLHLLFPVLIIFHLTRFYSDRKVQPWLKSRKSKGITSLKSVIWKGSVYPFFSSFFCILAEGSVVPKLICFVRNSTWRGIYSLKSVFPAPDFSCYVLFFSTMCPLNLDVLPLLPFRWRGNWNNSTRRTHSWN